MRKLTLMLVLGCAAALMLGGAVQAAYMDAPEDDTDNTFTFHGEARFRGEAWGNLTDFTESVEGGTQVGNPGNDDRADDDFDLFPYRIRMSAEGNLGGDVIVFGEFQGSGVYGGRVHGETLQLFGDENETIDGNVSLYRGFVKLQDVGDSVLDLTFGRFEIVLDNGLHFSNLPYYNGISHDGVMATWDWEKFEVTGFWTRNSESNLNSLTASNIPTNFVALDEDAGADNDVAGAHFKYWLGDDHRTDLAAYVFYQSQNDPTLSANNADSTKDDRGEIYTVGGRFGRAVDHEEGGFFWNAEVAFQFGDHQPCALVAGQFFQTVNALSGGGCDPTVEDETLDAAGAVAELFGGFAWGEGWQHTVWANYTLATGDDDPNDEDFERFMPLFQDFHRRLGSADMWDLSNIESISAGYKGMVGEKHAFGASVYQFNKAEDEDVSFSPLTGVFIDCDPPSGESCDDDLGQEVDVFYNYYMTSNFSFDVAYAYYEPGDAVEDHFSDFGTFEDLGEDGGFRLTAQARARW